MNLLYPLVVYFCVSCQANGYDFGSAGFYDVPHLNEEFGSPFDSRCPYGNCYDTQAAQAYASAGSASAYAEATSTYNNPFEIYSAPNAHYSPAQIYNIPVNPTSLYTESAPSYLAANYGPTPISSSYIGHSYASPREFYSTPANPFIPPFESYYSPAAINTYGPQSYTTPATLYADIFQQLGFHGVPYSTPTASGIYPTQARPLYSSPAQPPTTYYAPSVLSYDTQPQYYNQPTYASLPNGYVNLSPSNYTSVSFTTPSTVSPSTAAPNSNVTTTVPPNAYKQLYNSNNSTNMSLPAGGYFSRVNYYPAAIPRVYATGPVSYIQTQAGQTYGGTNYMYGALTTATPTNTTTRPTTTARVTTTRAPTTTPTTTTASNATTTTTVTTTPTTTT